MDPSSPPDPPQQEESDNSLSGPHTDVCRTGRLEPAWHPDPPAASLMSLDLPLPEQGVSKAARASTTQPRPPRGLSDVLFRLISAVPPTGAGTSDIDKASQRTVGKYPW